MQFVRHPDIRGSSSSPRTYAPYDVEALTTLGMLYFEVCSTSESIKALQEGIECRRAAYAVNYTILACDLFRLGRAWQEIGQNYQALDKYKEGLAIERLLASTHDQDNHFARRGSQGIIKALLAIGKVQQVLGNIDDALVVYHEVLQTARLFPSDQVPLTLSVLRVIANIYLEKGDTDRANAHWTDASRVSQQISQMSTTEEENNIYHHQVAASQQTPVFTMEFYSHAKAA